MRTGVQGAVAAAALASSGTESSRQRDAELALGESPWATVNRFTALLPVSLVVVTS